jgi:hypothetical protein
MALFSVPPDWQNQQRGKNGPLEGRTLASTTSSERPRSSFDHIVSGTGKSLKYE